VTTQSPYQETLIQTLEIFGWRWMHVRPVFDAKAKRWLTPTTAKGWPDLSCVHPRSGVALFAEAKGAKGKPTPEQLDWLRWWHRVPSAAAVCFRASDDWNMVAGWLAEPATLPSGYGWLPTAEHRPVITRADAATFHPLLG
jgi:hypothetical protein